jgi:hypothetical protein
MKALRPTNIPFPSTGSFTRASTATYIEDGVLKTAAVDEPRWQYGVFLYEAAKTNLILYSQEIDNAYWIKSTCSATTTTATTAPDGTNTAELITSSGTTGHVYPNNTGFFTSAGGASYTFSFFAKAGNESVINVLLTAADYSGTFNLTTGLATTTSSTTRVQMIPVGNGWFRCILTALNVANDSNTQFQIGRIPSTKTFYLWGVQLEVGDTATSYIATSASTASRSADTITGTGLIYTSATDARPLWSNATTYSVGQVIRYNNTVYESLQNTNLNKQPDTNPTWWLNLGADNISAAFDGKVGSKTTATDNLRMIIKPGTNIDSVGYIEATASTISTSAVDEDYNTIYSYKSGLDSSVIEDWYDYFFIDPLGDPLTQVVHQGISPLDPSLAIGVEIVRSGTVELGVFVTGQTTSIGKTQYGLRAGIVDYSKKEADEFGNVTIVERTYSKRLEGDVYVYNYDLNKVQRFLYNVRATPVLWIASDDTELAEVSNVYGFYKDFSTTIAYPDVSMCSLQIEGLT